MTADSVFSRFPTFIREYIYASGWEELRQTQLDAARVIFEGEDNLLLSSSTASGKTEAVFFPILSELCALPLSNDGVKVLYIAPLKSLINDQFGRMDALLDQSGIPVCHWHGDVGSSQKTKLLKNPEGILQITPESLESMLVNRPNDIPRLFSTLRYVVVDEVHTMIGTDRGNQVICLLARISRLAGCRPRRIGLSATIGDLKSAADWLADGSGRKGRVLGLGKAAAQLAPKDPIRQGPQGKLRTAGADGGQQPLGIVGQQEEHAVAGRLFQNF